jgi:hypothetical protein
MLQWPINKITFVKQNSVTLTSGVDYMLYEQYLSAGQIYRGQGWLGPQYVRGLTADPFAGEYIFEVSYNAGYILPGDSAPVGVTADNLPYDLQFCTSLMVAKVYGLSNAGNLGENLASVREGGLAYSWDNPAKIPPDLFQVIAGMPVQFASMLTPYKRWSVAS